MKKLPILSIFLLCSFALKSQIGIGTENPTAGLDLESTLSINYLFDQDFETGSIAPFETYGDGTWFSQSAYTYDVNSNFALRSGAINAAQKSYLTLEIEAPANKETLFGIKIYYELTVDGVLTIDNEVIEGPMTQGWYSFSKELVPGLNTFEIVLSGSGDGQRNPGLVVVDNAISVHYDNHVLRVADGNEGKGRTLIGDTYGNVTWVDNNFIQSENARAIISDFNFRIDFDGINKVQVKSNEFNVFTQDNQFGSIHDFYGNVSWGQNNTIYPFANQNSTAWGNGNASSNTNATSWGEDNISSGVGATSWGFENVSSGNHTSCWGSGNIAGGQSSTAFGMGNTAGAVASTAFGSDNSAIGNFSVAIGQSNSSAGAVAITMGFGNSADGLSGIAIGSQNRANVDKAISIGNNTSSNSYKQITLGSHNKDFNIFSSDQWKSTDPLLVVGNGETSATQSNAMVILKNGFVGLGDVAPLYALHLPDNATSGTARAHSWSTYSDRRIKSKIQEVSYGLEAIMELRPVSYFQHNSNFRNGSLSVSETGTSTIGLIAQEVYKIIPEAVRKPANEQDELWGMEYEKLIPVLIRSIQELKRSNEELQTELDNLKISMRLPDSEYVLEAGEEK